MKRFVILTTLLGAAACAPPAITPRPMPMPAPVPAPVVMDVPQSAQARFVNSVAANGCALTSANTAQIMTEATLSREDLARIMTDLRAEGRGTIDGQAFRLTSGACA